MEKEKDKDLAALDLIEILQYIWKGKFFILALMVISALLMAIRVEFFVSDKYTADGVLYIYSQNLEDIKAAAVIQNEDGESDPNSTSVTGAAINDARTMSTTYMETLKLRSFLTEVSQEIGGVYSWEQIKSMMQVSSVNETEYVMVSVTAEDPEMAYKIAQCICRKAQGKFSEIFKGGEAIIVDKVIYPQYPDSKGGLQKVGFSLVLGGILGALIIILINFFDRRIRKSDEISSEYNISVLGETMLSETGKKKKGKKKKYAHSEADRIIDEYTDFDTVETYKAIRTNIMFSVPKHEKGKVIVVTSASPGEGKTTTSINLALIFAQMGVKVLLVDCDLRKPRVHRYMGIKRGEGVSNIICGYTEAENAIHRNVRANLDVITAGDIPPNPAELFENQSYGSLIERLQGKYEYIFIDTPPMTVVTDAVVVMKHCTGTILVARQGVTITDLFAMAVAEAKRANAKILGAVFHDSKEKQSKHYYYQRGKYGYKYKYNYRYGDDAPVKGKREKNNA